jgi:CRISPR-associated protein (TIGR03984 family)
MLSNTKSRIAGNNENTINGLELKEISSQAFPVSAFDELDNKQLSTILDEINKKTPLSFIRKGAGVAFVVAYLDYKVLIGKYTNGSFPFFNNEQIEPKFIQRIRIFNQNEELMLWRSEGKLKGRYRKDNDGNKIDVVDNDQVLFGTKAEEINGYTKLTEERGTEIIIPFKDIILDGNKKEDRIKIKTRNYIGFNEIHQATYIDSRFVEFTFVKENNPTGGIK